MSTDPRFDHVDHASARPAFPRPVSEAEQDRETDESWPVFGAGPMTASQARGAIIWGLLMGFAGLLLGIAISIIPMGGLSWVTRLVVLGAIGALAGGTAGVLYGGGREAELEEDAGNQIGPPSLNEPIRDPESARRAVEDLRSSGDRHGADREERP